MFGSTAKSTALNSESHSVSKLIMCVQDADRCHHEKNRIHRRARGFFHLWQLIEESDDCRAIEKRHGFKTLAAQGVLEQLIHRVAGRHQRRRREEWLLDAAINFVPDVGLDGFPEHIFELTVAGEKGCRDRAREIEEMVIEKREPHLDRMRHIEALGGEHIIDEQGFHPEIKNLFDRLAPVERAAQIELPEKLAIGIAAAKPIRKISVDD